MASRSVPAVEKLSVEKPPSTREMTVNGLFGGLLAGLAMLAVIMLLGLLRGELPGNQLARFSSGELVSPWMGLLRHEAVSVVYGMLFGLLSGPLLRRYPGRLAACLAGLIYGLALFILAELVVLPGTDSPLRAVPVEIFGLAHLIYGLVLGAFLDGQNG
jgi:hypothetical protein